MYCNALTAAQGSTEGWLAACKVLPVSTKGKQDNATGRTCQACISLPAGLVTSALLLMQVQCQLTDLYVYQLALPIPGTGLVWSDSSGHDLGVLSCEEQSKTGSSFAALHMV